jgi:hypothetical protein
LAHRAVRGRFPCCGLWRHSLADLSALGNANQAR